MELPTTASLNCLELLAGHGEPDAQIAWSAPAAVNPAQPTILAILFVLPMALPYMNALAYPVELREHFVRMVAEMKPDDDSEYRASRLC